MATVDLGKVVPTKGVDYYTEEEKNEMVALVAQEIDLSDYQTKIDNSHKLSTDLIDDSSSTNKFVTASDISNWDSKGTYSKPDDGIPASDFTNTVQTSLEKADTSIQSSDLSNYVTTTDYATSSTGGVLKVSNGDYGMTVDNGALKGTVKTLTQYNDMSSKGLVSKGTLENVLTDRIGDIETALGGI